MKFVVIAAGAHEDMVRTCETGWDALNQASVLTGKSRGLVTISDETGHEYSVDDFRRRFIDTTRHAAPSYSAKTDKPERRDMPVPKALQSRAR